MDATPGNWRLDVFSPHAHWDQDGGEERRWMSVGEVMILEQVYDPDQLWLPFMKGTIFNTDAPFEPLIALPRSFNTARVPFNPRPERDVPQYVLPFHEGKIIQHCEIWEQQEASWPTFDRDPAGHMLEIKRFASLNVAAINAWVVENCAMRVVWHYGILGFESADDHLLATLRLA